MVCVGCGISLRKVQVPSYLPGSGSCPVLMVHAMMDAYPRIRGEVIEDMLIALGVVNTQDQTGRVSGRLNRVG